MKIRLLCCIFLVILLCSFVLSINTNKTKDSPYFFAVTTKTFSPEFSWENIERYYLVLDSVSKKRHLALGSFKVIENNGSLVYGFTNEDIQPLPVSDKYSRENIKYIIYKQINDRYSST